MVTYVVCNQDNSIDSVRRCDELPDELLLGMIIPEGGFLIDLTGQGDFDSMDVLDIHNGYKADTKKKKLIKI